MKTLNDYKASLESKKAELEMIAMDCVCASQNGDKQAENELEREKKEQEGLFYELAHYTLNLQLFTLNTEKKEEFTFEFSSNVVFDDLFGLVKPVKSVSTISAEGVVWFTTTGGTDIDDDEYSVEELYKLTMSLFDEIEKRNIY